MNPKTNDQPTLSIVIPTLNEERYISRLLDDIISSKTNGDVIEIIVSDNGSLDNTINIVEKYSDTYSKEHQNKFPKVRLVHARKKGVAFARNHGALHSNGEYIFFLDADQRLNKNFIANTLSELKTRELDAGSFYFKPGNSKQESNNIKYIDQLIFFGYNNLIFRPMQYILPIACGGAGIISKRDAHQKIGGFKTGIEIGEDMDYVIKIAKMGKFRMLNCECSRFDMRRFEEEHRWRVHGKWFVGGLCYFLGMKKSPWKYWKDAEQVRNYGQNFSTRARERFDKVKVEVSRRAEKVGQGVSNKLSNIKVQANSVKKQANNKIVFVKQKIQHQSAYVSNQAVQIGQQIQEQFGNAKEKLQKGLIKEK
jgi:glycosyltransferase involved in cell wall biosynthesis